MRIDKKMKHIVVKSFVLGTMTTMLLLAAGCKKKETPTIIDDTLVTPIITPSKEPTIVPTPIAMTPAPGVTITPTLEPTLAPVVLLTQEEAETKLKEKVDTKKYTYELSDDNLNIDGKVYFIYIMFEDGVEMQPAIIVDAQDGTLSLYDSDGNVTAFTKFPVDNTESLSSGEYEITQTSALALLKMVTKEKIGLPNNLSQYIIIADEWTTVIGDDECYCFNVFEGSEEGQLAGRYYVSTTGVGIYKQDEEIGEFELIN
jgi:hypothetical protein